MRSEDEIRADADSRAPFSNASEHDLWAERFCYNGCVHDDVDREIYCPIIMVALAGRDGRPSWPREWTRRRIRFVRDAAGAATSVAAGPGDTDAFEVVDVCTEYQQRPDPADEVAANEPAPACDGQLDLLDFTGPRFLVTRTADGVVVDAAVMDRQHLLAAAEQASGEQRPSERS